MFELKSIAKESIPRAIGKAERYRLLNEPRQAESICLDVLAIEPAHQQALICLLLALADQFGTGGGALVAQARQILPRLDGEYEQIYYAGIISEREARAQFAQSHPGAGGNAYVHLREAMAFYERADERAAPGDDDAVLRYNTCVRMIQRHSLVPPPRDEEELPLE
jgi:hypothetical protein